ncbi:DUF397 domain-containing protein [Salininema proteolyticum]|uniref:DUF397 domain-containing protein n=1 Tax=Salininema proteolyticum TaxID=1607685 RepID=A0ABV8TZ35_9ACTN
MLTRQWKKSSRSGNTGNCVEVRLSEQPNADVEVKDSKLADSPILRASAADWRAITGR